MATTSQVFAFTKLPTRPAVHGCWVQIQVLVFVQLILYGRSHFSGSQHKNLLNGWLHERSDSLTGSQTHFSSVGTGLCPSLECWILKTQQT